MTEPKNASLQPPEESARPPVAPPMRKSDQVNGPSSTIGTGTGLGLGCLVLIVLLVVVGFVARSAGWF